MRAAAVLIVLCACAHQQEETHGPVVMGWGLGFSTKGPSDPWIVAKSPGGATEGGGPIYAHLGTGWVPPPGPAPSSTIDEFNGQTYEDQHAVVGDYTPPLLLLPPANSTTNQGPIPPANTMTVQVPPPVAVYPPISTPPPQTQ